MTWRLGLRKGRPLLPAVAVAGAVAAGVVTTGAASTGDARFGTVATGAAPTDAQFSTGKAGTGPSGVVRSTQARPIVVASKPFAESYVLAEVFAQLLEAGGHRVDRRLGLGTTEVALQALVRNEIDVYPEYTGTGLAAVLAESPSGGSVAVFRRVSDAFQARWGARWLPPLGFANNYAVAMRRAAADSLGIRTLSGLATVAPRLSAGFSPDFAGRADGLLGLTEAYDGMEFREVRNLLQAVKYQALVEGAVDVIDAYSTDGAVARYDLAVMADDRGFFPPYDAAPLASRRFYEERSEAALVLSSLAGRIDEAVMRRANERVELGGTTVAQAARELLVEIGLGGTGGSDASPDGEADTDADAGADANSNAEANASAGHDPDVGPEGRSAADLDTAGRPASRPSRSVAALPAHMWSHRTELGRQALRHLLLVLVSLGAAALVAVPAGVALERRRSLAEGAIRAAGLLQTIPGIALLAFMIPIFGIGAAPATAALFLYSLLPILRNTYTGIVGAAPGAVEAGRALGMTEGQLLRSIRLPLAAPVVMAGVRTAAVINVGTATLAAFVGGGGLGDPIVAGLALSDPVMILSGAVPAATMALAVDWGLARAEARVAPRGVREEDR